ncbi:MAG: hypothetical protein K5761_06130 [Clostridiales bacterium]|nr:hypothetical protein [Clostridiales bacterium]
MDTVESDTEEPVTDETDAEEATTEDHIIYYLPLVVSSEDEIINIIGWHKFNGFNKLLPQTKYEFDAKTVAPGEYSFGFLGNHALEILVKNYGDETVPTEDCYIDTIYYGYTYYDEIGSIPTINVNGVTIGDSYDYLIEEFGEPYYDDYGAFHDNYYYDEEGNKINIGNTRTIEYLIVDYGCYIYND